MNHPIVRLYRLFSLPTLGNLVIVLVALLTIYPGTCSAEEKIPQSLVLIREAKQAWLDGQLDRARELLTQVVGLPATLPHHRQEAQELLESLANRGAQGIWEAPPDRRFELPEIKPGLSLYVAPTARPEANGSLDDPYGTLEAALAAVSKLKATNWPAGGVEIVLRGGTYPVRSPIRIGPEHSGSAGAPLVVRAAEGELPILSGGMVLKNFEPVSDAEILDRLPSEARAHVLKVDLRQAGIQSLLPFSPGGFASARGFQTVPTNEVFWNKKALTLARWPNRGYVTIEKVSSDNPVESWAGKGSASGPIYFRHERLANWTKEPEAVVFGFWYWGWAESYELVDRIDPETGAIYLKPPYPRYGFGPGRPFFAVNLLCELDQPGEYYIDRKNLLLYLWPPGNVDEAQVEISLSSQPLLVIEDASHVRIQNITFELGAADAIHLRGGVECVIAGCVIRCFAGDGIVFRPGTGKPVASAGAGLPGSTGTSQVSPSSAAAPYRCGVLSSDIYTMGRGGIALTGGDRRTLTFGENFAENCHIYDLSRIHYTYTPAVLVTGVGNQVRHNLVHDINSSAFRLGGNEHVFEYNEVFRVVLESDDQGAVDMHGDPTARGNVFRYNYWHHIGGWDGSGGERVLYRGGIRFDDAICGNLVYGNVFYRASAGKIGFGAVQIHGGKDNVIDNNLFVDCGAAVSFTPWSANRWREFVNGALDRPDIDRSLFVQRYPELAQLFDNPNVNLIFRSVAADCGVLFLRDHPAKIAAFNWIGKAPEVLESVSSGNFRLRSDSPVWREIGFRPIPMDHIGLYPDRFRKDLAHEVRDAGRAGK